MRQGLEAYLAEFAGGLTEAQSRFAATPSYSTPASAALRPAPTPAVPVTADAVTELAPGSTALRPVIRPAVRLWVTSVPGWQGEMQDAAVQLAALERDAAALRAGGVVRRAEETFVRGAVHLQPNYEIREYPVPRDGACDTRQLVWADIWMRAQALLRKYAAKPPVGSAGADVFAWVRGIHAARRLMFEASNFRGRFFGLIPTVANRTVGVVYQEGLASDAQARGAYTRPDQPAGVTILNAMQFAPVPRGGYQELLGVALRQRPHMWWTTSSVRFRNADGTVITEARLEDGDGVLAGDAQIQLEQPNGVFYDQPGRELHAQLFDNAEWVAQEVALLWMRTSSDSPLRTIRISNTTSSDRRRWRAYDITTDIGAWIQNAYDYAAYFGDPRLSLAAVVERTTGFYLNTYLDYGASSGLVPREDLAAAQAQASAIQARIQAELRTAVYTATGLMTAILSLIPVVGSIIGGVIAGVVALLVELGGAASGGAFVTPVLPLYSRGFAGSCRSSTWIEPAPAPSPGSSTPAPEPAPAPPPEDNDPAKGPAGLVIGVGSLAFGLWLISRSTR